MPKIRYLHKTREGIPSIYPKKSGDILQNMNFSRYYRNRGKFIYGFDPNIIPLSSHIFLEFLESTQHDTMEQLRRMYKERTEETVINYINAEINKESRGLIDVIKHGVEFDNGIRLKLMYRKPDSTINTEAVANYQKNFSLSWRRYITRQMSVLTWFCS